MTCQTCKTECGADGIVTECRSVPGRLMVWVIGQPIELHKRKETALAAIQLCIIQDRDKFKGQSWEAIDLALKAGNIELALHLYRQFAPHGNPPLWIQEHEVRQ